MSPSRTPAKAVKLPKALQRTEHDEQCDVIAWADLSVLAMPDLAMLFAIPNAGGFSGGFRANVARVARLRREGVKSGVPDLMLAVAREKSHGLFVEMKREHGVPSDVTLAQQACHLALRTQGYTVVVAFGFEQARTAILNYLTRTA